MRNAAISPEVVPLYKDLLIDKQKKFRNSQLLSETVSRELMLRRRGIHITSRRLVAELPFVTKNEGQYQRVDYITCIMFTITDKDYQVGVEMF